MFNPRLDIGQLMFGILIMTVAVSGYAVEGNWSILSVSDISLADQNITLQISEYIFRKNIIHQKLVFRGCKQFVLQASIQQNQIFFNTNTYKEQSIINRTCPTSNPLDLIFKNLKIIFYFAINIDRLLFNDPFGRNIIVFKRLVNPYTVNIAGIWTLGQYGNTRSSLSAQISPTQIVFCQGNSVYNYSLNPKTRLIELIPIISNCPSTDLIKSLQSSKYFRFRNGILNFFDQNVTLAVQLIYNQAYDPNKPIFIVPLQSNKKQTTNQISPSNITGQWQIKSLFKIPMKNTKYSLAFNKTNLKLSGCTNYDYQYTLDSSKQIITVTQNKLNDVNGAKCVKSDDQLYINGVLKMYKYLLNSANGSQLLNFYDQKGQIGYSLALQPKINTNPVKSSTNKTSQIVQAPQKNPINSAFAPGKYLLLLLQRRDLPRVPITISGNTITFKRCNEIVQTFQIQKPNAANSKISIKGGAITKNKCADDKDEIYYGNLNLARSFTYDAGFGVIILKNDGGIETISISTA